MASFAQSLAEDPEAIQQNIVDALLKLTGAGTVGISLIEETDDGPVFRWVALAGVLKDYTGGCSPYENSPCGVTSRRGEPQLFAFPGRCFENLSGLALPIIEGLVVPVFQNGVSIGTVWMTMHDTAREIDNEDVRLMVRLSSFIAAALKATSALISARRATQDARFLTDLSHQLALMTDPEEIIRTACRSIGEQFNAVRCYFYVVSETEPRVTVKVDWSADGLKSVTGDYVSEDPRQINLWKTMARAPLAIGDILKNPLTDYLGKHYGDLGMRSYITSPFARVNSDTIVLGVSSGNTRQWTAGEQALLENLAARVWPLVERAVSDLNSRQTEKRYRDLLSGLPIACYTLDAEGRVDFFNKAATDLWGRTPEIGAEFWCGSHRMALLDGTYISADVCPAAIAMKETRQIRGVEAFVVRPDGTRRRIVPHPDPIFNAEGKCVGLINVVADVTEERAAQDALRDRQAFLQSVIGATTDCVKVLNLKGELQWMNDNGQLLLEVGDFAKILGKPWFALWPEEGQLAALGALQAANENRVGRFRGFCPTVAGTPKWWDVIVTAIPGADGKPERFLSVSRDVTEQAETERALSESRKKLETHAHDLERHVRERTLTLQQTVSELEAFSYSISHDMRAPLRAMQSFAALIQEDHASNLDATGHDYLRRIINAAERMDRLIRDILVFSRLARNELPMDAVELPRLLSDILESYPQFGRDRAQIQINLPFPKVWGNEAALTQCFSNLIDNAVKFVPAGVLPKIEIWAEVLGNTVRIAVKDNGIGIDPRFHAKVFGIFYQHDPKFEGTGIGLAVVRKAAERMGGSVTVESAAGQGSTFYVEIRRAQ